MIVIVTPLLFTLMQSKRNHWIDVEEIGIEELSGIEYGIITDSMVRSMFGLLGPSLSKVLQTKHFTKEEEDLATSSQTLFNTLSHVDMYLSDLRLYMEACIAAEKSGIQVQFLVTDDHAFFKGFVKSPIAEQVLRKEVKAALGLRKAVKVKLAGEVIPGM